VANTDDLGSQVFYHGTRADLKPGDLIGTQEAILSAVDSVSFNIKSVCCAPMIASMPCCERYQQRRAAIAADQMGAVPPLVHERMSLARLACRATSKERPRASAEFRVPSSRPQSRAIIRTASN
jgi:hypothetical protein